ncbi:MAG: hypothetical protein Q9159_007673, partial [Coniocarpon cinnabarinum]
MPKVSNTDLLNVEVQIAFQIILQDLNSMQKVVQRNWEAYKADVITIDAILVTTNVALMLAKDFEKQLKPLLDDTKTKFTGFANLIKKYFAASSKPISAPNSDNKHFDDDFNMLY